MLAPAVSLPAAQPARAAFWQELAERWFHSGLVCRDGIFFGLADKGSYTYHVFGTLTDDGRELQLAGHLFVPCDHTVGESQA